MEEPASKTRPTLTSTAAAAPCISLVDTVRTASLEHALTAPTCSVSSSLGIKCVTTSVTTTSVSGMEETAPLTGGSHGPTAPPLFLAGITSKMDNVTRSVTTPDVCLTALSVRRPNQPPASMTSTVQTTMVMESVTRVATQRLVAGMAWIVHLTLQPNQWMAP